MVTRRLTAPDSQQARWLALAALGYGEPTALRALASSTSSPATVSARPDPIASRT